MAPTTGIGARGRSRRTGRGGTWGRPCRRRHGAPCSTPRASPRRRPRRPPPVRRRRVEVPCQLHHPLWIEDPDFDIEYHVRRAALPAPGGALELAEFAADVFSRPLDRSRPLWEMYVLEGLENGHIATITKT